MYSRHNEGKSVVAERFIRKKNYKCMTSVSKNVHIDNLDNIVNKYNNTYHSTIKMKPVDVKPSTYFDFNVEKIGNDQKFKIGNHVKISKYKNIVAKDYFPNWSKEGFLTKKVKNTVPCTYVISDFKVEKIVGTFYKQELQKSKRI